MIGVFIKILEIIFIIFALCMVIGLIWKCFYDEAEGTDAESIAESRKALFDLYIKENISICMNKKKYNAKFKINILNNPIDIMGMSLDEFYDYDYSFNIFISFEKTYENIFMTVSKKELTNFFSCFEKKLVLKSKYNTNKMIMEIE